MYIMNKNINELQVFGATNQVWKYVLLKFRKTLKTTLTEIFVIYDETPIFF